MSLRSHFAHQVCTGLVYLMLRLCTSQTNICPTSSVGTIHDLFGRSNFGQQGLWHRIPCTEYRSNEPLLAVYWYKGHNISDPSHTTLIFFYVSNTEGCPDSIRPCRYEFSLEYSLVIEGVEAGDEGSYLCRVVPQNGEDRVGIINIHVIGKLFPASTSDTSTTANVKRGRRQTLTCQCAPQTPHVTRPVVYWSTGKGISADTDIIGARLQNNFIILFQYGADYSIGRDFSLTLNSLYAVNDTQRFWCHAFRSDGRLSSCYIDVRIRGHPVGRALKASDTHFYLKNKTCQIIPCTNWTPGDKTCEISWMKIDTTGQHHLSYSVSTDDVEAPDPTYDLAGDFGLIIKSADEDHAGDYSCTEGPGSTYNRVTVSIIGETFMLDNGIVTANDNKTFEPDRNYSLNCSAVRSLNPSSGATLIWSYGATEARMTTVIGTLDLPDGSKNISQLRRNRCFDMSSRGSLFLNNCSQQSVVRYWCHVFPFDDVVIRSFVDVAIKHQAESTDVSGSTEQSTNATVTDEPHADDHTTVIIVVCIVSAIVLLAIIAGYVLWKNQRQHFTRAPQDTNQDYSPVPNTNENPGDSETRL